MLRSPKNQPQIVQFNRAGKAPRYLSLGKTRGNSSMSASMHRVLGKFLLTAGLVGLVAFWEPIGALAQSDSMTREVDPVVISGDLLKDMWGVKLDGLRLLASDGQKMRVIPFQIDKVDPDGNYIIPSGSVPRDVIDAVGFDDRPESKKRVDRIRNFEKHLRHYEKEVQEGKIDAAQIEKLRHDAYFEEHEDELDYNDDLVFLARDAGARVAQKFWPGDGGIEIEIRDPIDGGKAWAYLLSWDSKKAPALSDRDYVNYQPNGDIVESPLMRLNFVDDSPLVMEEAFPKRDGKELPNIIDRFKMRIKLRIKPLFCLGFEFDENNIKAYTVGYKDGPIRVLRRNVFWIVLAGIKLPFVPQALVYYTFYENGLYGPTEIQNPFDPKYVLCSGSVGGGGLDFLQNMTGARISTDANNGTAVFDGTMSPAEKKLVTDNQRWAVVTREDERIGFIIRVVYGPELARAGVNNKFFFVDDPNEKMEPEREPGARYTGFGVNILEVPKGKFKLWFYMYISGEFDPNDQVHYLRILDQPLEIKKGE